MIVFSCLQALYAKQRSSAPILYECSATVYSRCTLAISGSAVGGSDTTPLFFLTVPIPILEGDSSFFLNALFTDAAPSKNLTPFPDESKTVVFHQNNYTSLVKVFLFLSTYTTSIFGACKLAPFSTSVVVKGRLQNKCRSLTDTNRRWSSPVNHSTPRLPMYTNGYYPGEYEGS